MSTIITFIRDSIAFTGEDDKCRSLTDEGVARAVKLRECLNNPSFDTVIFSDRYRALQTSQFVAGHCKDTKNHIVLPELWVRQGSNLEQLLAMAYRDLGDGPLTEYFTLMRGQLVMYGLIAANKLTETIHTAGSPKEVLVVGHSVLLQALALMLCANPNGIVNVALGPCQGFHLEMRSLGDFRLVDHIVI